jgi:integrase
LGSQTYSLATHIVGCPIILIPRRLITFLRLARRRGHEAGHVISFQGHPIKDIKRAFRHAVRVAGLIDVTPHTLRHTAASWMVQHGVSFAKVARYLGHSDSRTTEQVYAHHAPDYLVDAARAFD